MKISIENVGHVATLARLQLSEEEKALFSRQMGEILEYVDKLKQLDTESVLPMSHAVPLQNAFREDAVSLPIGAEKALCNAPERCGNFYRVPKVIE